MDGRVCAFFMRGVHYSLGVLAWSLSLISVFGYRNVDIQRQNSFELSERTDHGLLRNWRLAEWVSSIRRQTFAWDAPSP